MSIIKGVFAKLVGQSGGLTDEIKCKKVAIITTLNFKRLNNRMKPCIKIMRLSYTLILSIRRRNTTNKMLPNPGWCTERTRTFRLQRDPDFSRCALFLNVANFGNCCRFEESYLRLFCAHHPWRTSIFSTP